MTQKGNGRLESGQVFVARQPILDKTRRLFGYELLFRPSSSEPAAPANSAPDFSTAKIISDGLLTIGLDTLTDRRRAFVRIGRRLLLDGIPAILPANRVVLELGTDIEADKDVVTVCQQLRKNGYSIAIDDFVLTEWTADLVPLADYLKVDFLAVSDPRIRAKSIARNAPGGPVLIAKRIETVEMFDLAVREGFHLFQGYFFGRPVIKQARELPGSQLGHLRLVQALNNPDLSVHQIEDLIKHDASLCYRILRTVNSAATALYSPVQSIRQALVSLGRDTIRRWASLWALAGLNDRANSELVVMSTVRARCCELLGTAMRSESAAAEGFLVGMCSLLDAILERPMSTILPELPLNAETQAALRGEDNPRRRMLDLVIAYERGEWDRCVQLATEAGIDPELMPPIYADAIKWANQVQRGGPTAVAV